MSRRLLKEWETRPLRTAIDDLESFSWILLWVALHKTDQRTAIEANWLRQLSSDDISIVASCKGDILLSAIQFQFNNTNPFSHPLVTFLSLLQQWWIVALRASTDLGMLISKHSQGKAGVEDVLEDDSSRHAFYEELEGLSLRYYAEYIRLGTDFLMESGFYNNLP